MSKTKPKALTPAQVSTACLLTDMVLAFREGDAPWYNNASFLAWEQILYLRNPEVRQKAHVLRFSIREAARILLSSTSTKE